LDQDGRSNFYHLLFHGERPYFYAFDLLSVNARDLGGVPLLERKRRLRGIVPYADSRLLYLDHVEQRRVDRFRVVCERDLEGVVGKWALVSSRVRRTQHFVGEGEKPRLHADAGQLAPTSVQEETLRPPASQTVRLQGMVRLAYAVLPVMRWNT
jgi:hypothetical protein